MIYPKSPPSGNWTTTDLLNIMRSLAWMADASGNDEYSRGVRSAFAAIALAIGVSVPPHVPDDAPFRT
jgi:hypothetical protein